VELHAAQPLERHVALDTGADPMATLTPLWQGPADPVMRMSAGVIERAMRLETGPAAIRLEVTRQFVSARAWGAGAAEALDLVPALVGERDNPTRLVAHHGVIADLSRRLPGLRLTSGVPLLDTLLFSILAQKITLHEAHRSHRALVSRFGDAAPGPLRLMITPAPEKLARLPYWAFHPLGIERRRADTIRAVAAVAGHLPSLGRVAPEERRRLLTSLPGIGPWTAAEAVRFAFGDPDAVSVGDFHASRLVCRSLAGEPDGDDARMLELLEPYRGQRARVVLLLERGGRFAARRAPRKAARQIASI
jgi:3-methyladenine DNA glycosylase/8-oxoguanine DNA glycosylase